MPDTQDHKVMLTLAALAYRGFQDVLQGEPHEAVVRHALLDGLETFAPVRGHWRLVWGPATTRRVPLGAFHGLGVFDSNAMYVVCDVRAPNEYVVAIRGTNPISGPDWLFGDLWVGTAVPWPYATGGAKISASTAMGLAALQGMRSRRAAPVAGLTEALARHITTALHGLTRAGRAAVSGLAAEQVTHRSALILSVDKIIAHWIDSQPSRDALMDRLQQAEAGLRVDPKELRPQLLPNPQRDAELDLLTFLKTEADESKLPLKVTVTGHSKGGALASTVALWLKDALGSQNEAECWDKKQDAQVLCYAFAGPTPGNAEFAHRLDTVLGGDHHHVRNMNDVVTHVWQLDELQQIPGLYGTRTAPFGKLISRIVADVQALNYRQATRGVAQFSGALDTRRPLAEEFLHQHLDAYLAELGLLSPTMNAVTFFI